MPPDAQAAFWRAFQASDASLTYPHARRPEAKPFEAFSIGASPEDADAGATLILSGEKTATSSPLDGFDPEIGPPPLGALSMVLNGAGEPVAIVETVEIEQRRLQDLDEAFAFDYGEWDRTLPTLRQKLAGFYGEDDPALYCERFRVVYPAG